MSLPKIIVCESNNCSNQNILELGIRGLMNNIFLFMFYNSIGTEYIYREEIPLQISYNPYKSTTFIQSTNHTP